MEPAHGGRAPVTVAVHADHVQEDPGRGAHVILAELADLRLVRLDHDARGYIVAGDVQVRRRVRVGRLVRGGRGRRPWVRRRRDAQQRPRGQHRVHGEAAGGVGRFGRNEFGRRRN